MTNVTLVVMVRCIDERIERKSLYHGTTEATAAKIIQTGFNRSYAFTDSSVTRLGRCVRIMLTHTLEPLS